MIRAAGCLAALILLATTAAAADLRVTLTSTAGTPLEGAVVWLEPVKGTLPPAPHTHVVIDQQHKLFTPLVTAIQTGTAVDFPNKDNIRHSVYSFAAAKTFQLKLYSGKPAAPVDFPKPGIITLGCNIHDQMIAWIAVVDSAWFAVSGATGALVVTKVPEGDYRLKSWHPGLQGEPVSRAISIGAVDETLQLKLDAAALRTLLPDTEGLTHAAHP